MALRLLASERTHDRLLACRALSKVATEADWEVLQAAHASEVVPWIRKSLRQTVDRLSGVEPDTEPEVESPETMGDDFAAEVYSQAVETTAAEILHQLTAPLGLAREHARAEIEGYEGSETKKQLDRLGGLIDAIETLQKAASPPRLRRFDLASLIGTTCRSCSESCEKNTGHGVAVVCQGTAPSPLEVYSDPGLIETALANAVTNAIEAVCDAGAEHDPSAVVVTWGESEREVWVSVIDRGTGLPPNFQRAFKFGVSSKDGHQGVGLAHARRAMASLGGKVVLRPGEDQGCILEITWPKGRFEEQ